ncbi:MAG: oxygenase MpaB family protein [Paraperlucidibaca sp.]
MKAYTKRFGFMPNASVAAEIAGLDAQVDCQRIVHLLSAYEFSWDITRALEIALFYTYGSDSVAQLLDKTGEFEQHGQKRYDDTRLLIAHFMDGGWDHGEGARALARMNKTHANYRIPQEDFRFVLWTFMAFPIDWMARYARRAMTTHEQLAWFNFWRGIGQRMGLVDLPVSKATFDEWVRSYCRVHMVPNPASARVAEATVRIMENWLPRVLRGLVSPAVYSLMDDPRFVAAVGQKRPSSTVSASVRASLKLLGKIRKVWAIGSYPQTVQSTINRTYPGNNYEIEQLQPAHLQRRAAREAANTVD